MELGVFTVEDVKLGTMQVIYSAPNNAIALRQFQDLAQDKTTMIHAHPGDHRLVRLGTWDNDTGELVDQENMTLAWGTDFHEQTGEETAVGETIRPSAAGRH